jgi:hypothetical protein
MARGRSEYYPKRQIVNMSLVKPEDYTERILLCVPKFAWDVARAYLSVQARWRSTYAMAYHENYYETPNDAEFDIIDASIADFLSEEDMSCDLEAVMQDIVAELKLLVAKECGVACGGSGGAGVGEAPDNPYIDDGETPPPDFPTYNEYEAWKCAMSKFIIDQLMADLQYLKGLAVTEITTTLLAAALMTPIPFDDIGVMVGALITLIVEAVLDALIDDILTAMGADYDSLVCNLYYAISVSDAKGEIQEWALDNIGSDGWFFLSYFVNSDAYNRLFQEENNLMPSNDCAGCAAYVPTVFYDWDGDPGLLGWVAEDTEGTWSLTQSNDALVLFHSGAGISGLDAVSPGSEGYVVQAGDTFHIELELIGGVTTQYSQIFFTDDPHATVQGNGSQPPFARQVFQYDMTPHVGRTITYFRLKSHDNQTGDRTLNCYKIWMTHS